MGWLSDSPTVVTVQLRYKAGICWEMVSVPIFPYELAGLRGLLPGEGDVVSIGVPYHRVSVDLASNPDRAAEFVQSCFGLDEKVTVIYLVGEVSVIG